MTDPGDVSGRVRAWWDADAATYDDSSDHGWAGSSRWRAAFQAARSAGEAAAQPWSEDSS